MRHMKPFIEAMLAGVLVLTTAVVVLAHHGLAEFDQTTKVTMKGTVTAFRFMNPHSVVEFDAADESGKVKNWQAQLTSAVRLKGWSPASLEPGITVTVTGYRAKSGAPYLWVTSMSSSNGMEIGPAQAIP
jgi:hypothetical protein